MKEIIIKKYNDCMTKFFFEKMPDAPVRDVLTENMSDVCKKNYIFFLYARGTKENNIFF